MKDGTNLVAGGVRNSVQEFDPNVKAHLYCHVNEGLGLFHFLYYLPKVMTLLYGKYIGYNKDSLILV